MNATQKKFDLLRDWEAAKIRIEANGKNCGAAFIEYGDIERVIGTGRARCRCCGNKISKGQQSLKFFFDWVGCGSWTATQCQIHEFDSDCAG